LVQLSRNINVDSDQVVAAAPAFHVWETLPLKPEDGPRPGSWGNFQLSLSIDRRHFQLTPESCFWYTDLRLVEHVVSFAFEGGVRLQVDSNVQVAGPSSQSSDPLTAQSLNLTLI